MFLDGNSHMLRTTVIKQYSQNQNFHKIYFSPFLIIISDQKFIFNCSLYICRCQVFSYGIKTKLLLEADKKYAIENQHNQLISICLSFILENTVSFYNFNSEIIFLNLNLFGTEMAKSNLVKVKFALILSKTLYRTICWGV